MNSLNLGLIPIPGGIESWPAKRLCKVGGQPDIVVRVKVMLERMRRVWILQAEVVPPPCEGEDRIESADRRIQVIQGSLNGGGLYPVGEISNE